MASPSCATMKSGEFNSGPLMQFLTLLLYKLSKTPCLGRLGKQPGRIVLVSFKLCIKATAFTILAEASSMIFVAQNTSIPVSKVYCRFKQNGRVYILMERIRGQDLSQGCTTIRRI
jgi:hypothetical protein